MRVIRGAPGSGKTELIYREFSDAVRAGTPNLRLVLPTATLVRHSQHELARRGLVFSPNSVLSLSRFARERAGSSALIPDALLRAFVRDALRRINPPDFARVSTTDGMADVILDTIHLAENAGATPDRLSSVRSLSPLAKAFTRIWQAVDESVRRSGFLTRGALFRAASACQQPATVWMDGFLHLSPLESNLIRALAPVCDLTLTLGDTPASDEIYRLCLELQARTVALTSAARTPQATIVDAPTAEREAAEISRRILDLHSNSVPLREIAVAVRDTDTYVPLLRAAFQRFGIPARFYFPRPLRHHPAAIFLNGLIHAVLNNWDFEPALRAFRAHPRWGTHPTFDRFDFAVRKQMPAHGASEFLALAGAGGALQNSGGWLHDRLAECLRIASWRDDLLRPAEWADRFETMATSLYRPAEPDPASTSTAIDSDAARSHSAALSAWIHAVASIVNFWSEPNRPISLDDFWTIAADAIDSAVIHAPDDRANVVHVMSVHEARQWNVHTLILCGLTDRDFPRRATENLIFPDRDIDRLPKTLPLRKLENSSDEGWLFDALRTRATGNLILTVPQHDTAGRAAERSRFLENITANAEPARLCRVALPPPPPPGLAGLISTPALLDQIAAAHRTIGATALEDLVQCPFKFFAGRTLRLEDAPERPAERLQPRTTGSILHEALEKWQSDRNRDFVQIFEETFNDVCRRDGLQSGYRLEVARYTFRNIARQASATDEWQLPDETWVEKEFELPFPGGITVKGRIDRIDVFGPDCIVIDYKSGKTQNIAALVESEAKLQGPIYALAARDVFGLNPVAMVFWAVRDDKPFGWGVIPGYTGKAELNPMPPNWADDARDRASARLTSYLAGNAAPQPHDETQCRWCDFAHACRYQRETRAIPVPQTGGANA